VRMAVLLFVALTGLAAGDGGQDRSTFLQSFPNLTGRTLLENDRLVVQEFVIQPGQSEGIHTHAGNQVVVHITGGTWAVRNGGKEITSEAKDGSVVWQDAVDQGAKHEARNVGDAPIEYLWVSLKPLPRGAESRGTAKGYRLVYPNIPGELQLENDRLVVQRFIVKPGAWEGIHPHPGNQLYVHVKGGKWNVKYGEKENVSTSKTGSIGWYHTVALSEQHQSGNVGDSPIDLIWITLTP
jgi:quercetin dioxygenase-like cupin family protein